MTTYTLNISIDQNGLKAISAAGQSVTIVKQTTGVVMGAYTATNAFQTAWLSFTPIETNVVTWTDDYSVYASETGRQVGEKIVPVSNAQAIGGSSYTLNTSGYFNSGVSGAVGINDYQVVNSDPNITINGIQMITSGLLQTANVNGTSISSPTCAASVLYNQAGTLTPIKTLLVFTSTYPGGAFISEVADNALLVDYSSSTSTVKIAYNDQNSKFVLA